MSRSLSPAFLGAFQNGILHPILEAVLQDNTLDFQIREEEVHVYYRGGKVLGIKPKDKCRRFMFSFDKKYFGDSAGNELPGMNVSREEHVSAWVGVFQTLKLAMDRYFTKHEKSEREFQQLIVRENTYSNVSNGTDFFITDIEYEKVVKLGAEDRATRFDLIGLHWSAEAALRRNAKNHRPRLCLFELKYGDGALSGKSGMLDHLRCALGFCQADKPMQDLKTEVVDLFKTKRDLGLVRFAKSGDPGDISALSDEKPYFVFLLANHNPRSSVLRAVLADKDYLSAHAELSRHMEIRYATASFLGYGLYESQLLTLNDFVEALSKG